MNSKICLLITSFILIISCQDDIITNKNEDKSIYISYLVSIADTKTKGTPINNIDNSLFNDFGIFGYKNIENFDSSDNIIDFFSPNKKIVRENNGWPLDSLYYWPSSGYLSFFAYAPYNGEGIEIDYDSLKVPVLSYTVPSTITLQPDLMIAKAQKDIFREVVPITFSHALACVGVNVSGPNVGIDSIILKGVSVTGSISLDYGGDSIVWSNVGPVTKDNFKLGLIAGAQATENNDTVMASDGFLMMIPQQLSDSATLTIYFSGIDPKVIHLKNTSISNWQAGEIYYYDLKEGVYDFEVEIDTTSCNYYGWEFKRDIKSIYTPQQGTAKDIGWSYEIISSTSSDSSWINGISELAYDTVGGEISKKLWANVASYNTDSDIDNDLKKVTPISKENINDLSYFQGSYTTANCYVVNGPGWYKFPCWVMGNALNGAESSSMGINNSSCYPTSYPFFQTYNGSTISESSSLSIDTNDASAELLWQDAPGLINDVSISDDNIYIEFYVSPETIRQGNALIAIKSGGTIMWSWHIWVTNWSYSSSNPVLETDIIERYEMMEFNIGYCSKANYNYPERSITIRFKQNQSNIEKEITITQIGDTLSFDANSPYYQWGRKDPILSSNGNGKNKTYFGPVGMKTDSINSPSNFAPIPFVTQQSSTGISLATSIQNPQVFYCTSGSWCSTFFQTLWETSSYSKSIYDPSPYDFQTPYYDFSSLLNGNMKSWTIAPYPGFIYFVDEGIAVLRAAGKRDNTSGEIINENDNGYYWCASYDSDNDNYYYITFSTITSQVLYTYDSNGQSVCSIRYYKEL